MMAATQTSSSQKSSKVPNISALPKMLERAKNLNEDQRSIVAAQIESHMHKKYAVDITLHLGEQLKGFTVYPNIMRPERMTSLWLARFLHANSPEFREKICLDMGCGSGIQGIVMARDGAKKVVLSDISKDAVANTKENILVQGLSGKATAVLSDLFAKVKGKFDFIVFNQPFFGDKPLEEFPVTLAMLNPGDLICRFLEQAPKHLNKGGKILMAFFHRASPVNNPALVAPDFGYLVNEKYSAEINVGLQQGKISFYELTPKQN